MEISREQVFVPGPEDVGRKLKIEAAAYSLETGEMLMSRVVKTDVVLARALDPRKRALVSLKSGPGGGPRFRVATYNVLAEIYATGQQYPYCDFWALSWEYRFHNIMREIMDASPDVLCLQEIQADHYETHVYGAMSDAGYDGVFKQKTRQSMGLAGKVDGCALFWRRSKFHLAESYSIEVGTARHMRALLPSQLGRAIPPGHFMLERDLSHAPIMVSNLTLVFLFFWLLSVMTFDDVTLYKINNSSMKWHSDRRRKFWESTPVRKRASLF